MWMKCRLWIIMLVMILGVLHKLLHQVMTILHEMPLATAPIISTNMIVVAMLCYSRCWWLIIITPMTTIWPSPPPTSIIGWNLPVWKKYLHLDHQTLNPHCALMRVFSWIKWIIMVLKVGRTSCPLKTLYTTSWLGGKVLSICSITSTSRTCWFMPWSSSWVSWICLKYNNRSSFM